MEQAPKKEFEAEIIDESIDNDRPTINEEESKAFHDQLRIGRERYCKISGENPDEVDIHPELELFFSYLNVDYPTPVKPTKERPDISKFGLRIGDKLYAFDEAFMGQILRFDAERITRKSSSIEEFYYNIHSESKKYREQYVEAARKGFVNEARAPYLDRIDAYKAEVDSGYTQMTIESFCSEAADAVFPGKNLSDEAALDLYKISVTDEKMGTLIEINDAEIKGLNEKKEENREKKDEISDKIEAYKKVIEEIGEDSEKKKELEEKIEKLIDRKNVIEEAQANLDTEIEKLKDSRDQIKKNREDRIKETERKYNIKGFDTAKLLSETRERYKAAKKAFIIENGFMTEEEYEELEGVKNILSDASEPLEKGKKAAKGREKDKYETSLTKLKRLEESVRVAAGKKYVEERGEGGDYPAIKRIFYSARHARYNNQEKLKEIDAKYNFDGMYPGLSSESEEEVSDVETVAEAVENLKEAFVDLTGREEPYGSIDELVAKFNRKYELWAKFREGEVKFGKTPVCAQGKVSEYRKEVSQEMRELVEADAYRLALNSSGEVSKKIVEKVFSEEDVVDAYFTPAGVFVKHSDGHCTTHVISPLAKEVRAVLDPIEAEAWFAAWNNIRNEAVQEGNEGFTEFINSSFREGVSVHSGAIEGEAYDKLKNLRGEFGFDVHNLFAPNRTMNHLPTAKEVETLAEVMPHIAKYINEVDFNLSGRYNGHVDMSLKGLASSLTALIGGTNSDLRCIQPYDIVKVHDGRLSLNFHPYQAILADTGYDHEKASAVLYSCVGYQLFSYTSPEKIAEFTRLLGEKVNVSKQAIYRNYGRIVPSPIERRQIAIKTYFVSEFTKFATDSSSDEMREFFESLAKGE